VHVIVAPPAAFVTAVHAVHTDAAPVVSSKNPSAQAETSLSDALVQVYVAPPAAFVTSVHWLQVAVVEDSDPALQTGWSDR
jgi:hypothetical protein